MAHSDSAKKNSQNNDYILVYISGFNAWYRLIRGNSYPRATMQQRTKNTQISCLPKCEKTHNNSNEHTYQNISTHSCNTYD